VTPLALALAVLVGVSLGLLGGGGSILTVPILVFVAEMEAKQAIAVSLVVVGVTAGIAAAWHAHAGTVAWRGALAFGPASMVGAAVAGLATGMLPAAWLLLAFNVVMVAAGVAMIRRRAPGAGGTSPGRLVAVGLGVGALTGLVGAGGGFVLVPALVLFGGLPMHRAVGTSLVVITLNCAAGLAGHAAHAEIPSFTTAQFTGAAVAGSLFGSAMAPRVAADRLRRGFGVLILLVAGWMAWQQGTTPVERGQVET
jgi:uncharacterized membrane protein YfcA